MVPYDSKTDLPLEVEQLATARRDAKKEKEVASDILVGFFVGSFCYRPFVYGTSACAVSSLFYPGVISRVFFFKSILKLP